MNATTRCSMHRCDRTNLANLKRSREWTPQTTQHPLNLRLKLKRKKNETQTQLTRPRVTLIVLWFFNRRLMIFHHIGIEQWETAKTGSQRLLLFERFMGGALRKHQISIKHQQRGSQVRERKVDIKFRAPGTSCGNSHRTYSYLTI